MKCNDKFTIANREAIFSQFYKLDVKARNALSFGSIKICPVKRMRKGAMNHKSASFKYVITFDGKQTFVCKNALVGSLYLGLISCSLPFVLTTFSLMISGVKKLNQISLGVASLPITLTFQSSLGRITIL